MNGTLRPNAITGIGGRGTPFFCLLVANDATGYGSNPAIFGSRSPGLRGANAVRSSLLSPSPAWIATLCTDMPHDIHSWRIHADPALVSASASASAGVTAAQKVWAKVVHLAAEAARRVIAVSSRRNITA